MLKVGQGFIRKSDGGVRNEIHKRLAYGLKVFRVRALAKRATNNNKKINKFKNQRATSWRLV